ncbi:hypothetical protein FKR84_10125 [Haloflavibacter putidus]|uniref:Signal transduction histidine kinase internal region domain-containing protein n=2 Tax=Haloflavibacter putidus TaxID=2576776 RepID=A0A507ZJ00_9FLAO|nr:hypothetical protein FKR84_10125 [Haloflavibacter putidus]
MGSLDFAPHHFLWHLSTTAVFLLFIISSIISYHSKERSFQKYAFYSFFLLCFLLLKTPYDIPLRDKILTTSLQPLNWYVQVIYNCLYFLFFMEFVDLYVYKKKLYKSLKKIVTTVFIASSILLVIAMLWLPAFFYQKFFLYAFTPGMFLLGVYVIIRVLQLPGNLKYFICFGSITYIILAVYALILSFGYEDYGQLLLMPIVYFYIGIFLEHLVFALGLAYKVRTINRKLIYQLQENQRIKNEQNILLEWELEKKEDEVLKLNAQAEQDRINQLKTKFKQEIHELHLTSLQSQMNPHFIFNALNSIKVYFIDNDKEKAIYYLNKFSKLIRKILEGSRAKQHSLQEEVELIELYMGIENMRFEDTIHFSINIEGNPDLSSLKVPPLILQPFVENALWHGLTLSKREKRLEIKIYQKDNKVLLEMEDNGIGRKKSAEYKSKKTWKRNSVGLKMTKERLRYFNTEHDKNHHFEIIDLYKNEEAIGTKVIFYFE